MHTFLHATGWWFLGTLFVGVLLRVVSRVRRWR